MLVKGKIGVGTRAYCLNEWEFFI